MYQILDYKRQINPKRGVVRATWPIFNFDVRNHISETSDASLGIYPLIGVVRVTWPVFINVCNGSLIRKMYVCGLLYDTIANAVERCLKPF